MSPLASQALNLAPTGTYQLSWGQSLSEVVNIITKIEDLFW